MTNNYSYALLALFLSITPAPVFAGPCKTTAKAIPNIHLVKVAEGLDSPTAITHAGDDSGRLFILDKLKAKPFLDIHDRVEAGGEKGLLGIAFHPRFQRNGRFFLNYTAEDKGLVTRVAEYRVNRQGFVKSNSERILLTVQQPYGNHNGGQLAFGPDGYLYIAMGDGGAGNDPHNNGQNLNTLLGAILRIDVNAQHPGKAYAIPKDNPFARRKDARPEIWAFGLRNPWRFAFDRLTGELYAADVGQDDVEEIDIIEKGKNYGWRIMEGPICTPGVDAPCNQTGLTPPIYSYTHDQGRSITGGVVYRGNQFPKLCGTYLYGDFVSQAIWGLRYQDGKVIQHKTLFAAQSPLKLVIDYFDDDALLVSTFGEDEAGDVYVAAYQSGRIYKIKSK